MFLGLSFGLLSGWRLRPRMVFLHFLLLEVLLGFVGLLFGLIWFLGFIRFLLPILYGLSLIGLLLVLFDFDALDGTSTFAAKLAPDLLWIAAHHLYCHNVVLLVEYLVSNFSCSKKRKKEK